MLSLNDTPLYDNQAIWVVRINLDSTTLKLATKTISLSNTWDGEVLLKDSLGSDTPISKSISIENGGGIGQIGALSFSIARYVNNTSADSFFDEFYPNNSNYLSSRTVEFGVVWEGAGSDADITWISSYYIQGYSYQFNSIDLECFEIDELEARELPSYVVQKEYDNKISYWDNAADEVYGTPIPVVYGSWGRAETEILQGIATEFLPTLLVDKENYTYMVSSNKMYSLSNLYKFDDGYNVKVLLKPLDGTTDVSNTNRTFEGSYITLLDDVGKIYGEMQLVPTIITANSEYTTAKEIYDRDLSTSFTLPTTKIVACGYDAGTLRNSYQDVEDAATNIKIMVRVSGGAGYTMDVEMYDRRDDSNVSSNGITLGTGVQTYTVSPFVGGTYAFEDILNWEIRLTNTSANTLYVYEAWIHIEKFHITGLYVYSRGTITIPRVRIGVRF